MDLYIIAGPNGVGKTTFAQEFLPNYADCKNFVNADLIAQAMAPFSPETAAVRAGRIMLHEIRSFAKRRVSFAFETTLSGRSYMVLLRQLKAQRYTIYLFPVGQNRGSRVIASSGAGFERRARCAGTGDSSTIRPVDAELLEPLSPISGQLDVI
jgi:predicted ABC-type ATPase